MKERKHWKQFTKQEIITAIKQLRKGEISEKQLEKMILSADENATAWMISVGILEPTK